MKSSSNHKFSRLRWTRACAFVGLLVASCLSACDGPEDRPGSDLGMGGDGPLGPPPKEDTIKLGACEDPEATFECSVYYEQANGVTSCFYGIQYCVGGEWSDCLDPTAEVPVL